MESTAPSNQPSTLPPAQPAYILRGHSAQVHAVHFYRENLRLLTADAEGWVISWDVSIKRPVVVWKAHGATILGVRTWGLDRILTQGRDGKLSVWQIPPHEEPSFSKVLPIDDASRDRKQPWLLHSLGINAINFCAFDLCMLPAEPKSNPDTGSALLIATPGVHDGTITLTTLPSEDRHSTVPVPRDVNVGMIMAIAFWDPPGQNGFSVVAGYESGHAAVWRYDSEGKWKNIYTQKAHTQPILSIAVALVSGYWFSSSADAIIARHPGGISHNSDAAMSLVNTKHAGQQGLCVRSDEKIFATAGWDGRMRVYSTETMEEMAVLKWHREGCYALAFAQVDPMKASTADPAQGSSTNQASTKRALTVAEKRIETTKSTHWLAAGSKDGKVSLWDIY